MGLFGSRGAGRTWRGATAVGLVVVSVGVSPSAPARAAPSAPAQAGCLTTLDRAGCLPGAPTDVRAVAGDRSVTLTFTPGPANGSTVTGWEVSLNNGDAWAALTTSMSESDVRGTVSDLTAKTTYLIKLRAAVNHNHGSASAAVEFTAATVPAAPTGVSATPGNASAVVEFTPGDDNGREIIRYEVRLDNDGPWETFATVLVSSTGNARTGTLTNLTNGRECEVRLRAVNAIGNGARSEVVEVIPNPVAPGPPEEFSVAPGDRRAVLTFEPPADDGGDAIIRYEAAVGHGQWTTLTTGPGAGDALTATISDLTNDHAYAIRVRAVNDYGESPPAGPLNVTPTTQRPGAPTSLSGVLGDGQVTVTFTPPADDGGDAITRYEAQRVADGDWSTLATESAGGGRLRMVVGSLTPNGEYDIRIRAVNGVGAGGPSATLELVAEGVPDAPTGVRSLPANGQVTIVFTPGDDNGSPITGYEISVDEGSWAVFDTTEEEGERSGILSELTNDETYSVRVRATNEHGHGPASEAADVTPTAQPPSAPTIVSVAPRDSALVVTFEPAEDDGGSPITGYAVTTGGKVWVALDTSIDDDGRLVGVVAGLLNDHAYQVRVRAINEVADGRPSAATAGTPLAPPNAPTDVTAEAGDASMEVTWQPPAGGGAAVTGYLAVAKPGPATCEVGADTTSCVLGAVAGTTYTVTVLARSASGDSAKSEPSAEATPALPDLPEAPPATDLVLTTTEGEITTAEPGEEIVFLGYGFAAHSTVLIAVYSQARVLAEPVTNARGGFRQAVTMPTGLTAGTHTVVAQGVGPNGRPRSMAVEIDVEEALPVTGASVRTALWTGSLLVIIGVVVLAVTRRSRRRVYPACLPPGV